MGCVMKDYSALSDFEINKLVAHHTGFFTNEPRVFDRRTFDPCNSWADAGPIIVDNRISLTSPFFRIGWLANNEFKDDFEDDYLEFDDENPLRAAMIVFLMMKDAE